MSEKPTSPLRQRVLEDRAWAGSCPIRNASISVGTQSRQNDNWS
jgi:hypothetical protein